MEQGISIIMPHLMNPENDRVLELNKQLIKENTCGNYELLYLANSGRKDLVYGGWNMLASIAKYELILFTNSDLFLAPNWDKNIYSIAEIADWISLRVVECGAIPSYHTMISKDFGMTASSFHRKEFEQFVSNESENRPIHEEGWVWYCPSVFKKNKFLEIGGFNNEPTFPYENDMRFKEKVESKGWKFYISNKSYAYHLQRARENSGEKEERN